MELQNKKACKDNKEKLIKKVELTLFEVTDILRKRLPKATGEDINGILKDLGFELLTFPIYK